MFGLMRPDEQALTPAQRARHRRYYCGLCHGVGVHVGHLWRGVHSHDAVFLATLADGLVDAPAEASACRCPLLPVVHQPTRDPSSVALRFAVGVQLLLADQWIADKQAEGSASAGLARRALDGPVRSGRALLDGLGIDLSAVEGIESRQAAVERGGAGPCAASAPTERSLAVVFGAMADLPGGPSGARAPLSALGAALGRCIYLIDALEDLEDDLVGGDYNPLVVAGVPSARRVAEAGRLLYQASQQADRALETLPWRSNRDLVEATVQALRKRGERALQAAERSIAPEGWARIQHWRAQPVWVHAAAALLTAITTLWAAFGQTAQAASVQVGQAVRATWRSWFLPRAEQCPCDNCGKACDGCTKGCDECGKACDQCGDSCNACGDSCRGCQEGCDDCMGSCTGCTESCTQCLDAWPCK